MSHSQTVDNLPIVRGETKSKANAFDAENLLEATILVEELYAMAALTSGFCCKTL